MHDGTYLPQMCLVKTAKSAVQMATDVNISCYVNANVFKIYVCIQVLVYTCFHGICVYAIGYI